MNPAKLPPLSVGDVALRFRVEWRGRPARAVVIGVQAVWVVDVSADGQHVTWSNARAPRAGMPGEYRHTSDRRELISIGGLEAVDADFLGALCAELVPPAPADAPPAAMAAPEPAGPRRTRRYWWQRDAA
jgi:hypothetical protein